jgi:hypothetical protein
MKTKLFFVAVITATCIGSLQKVNAQSWLLGGNTVSQDTSFGTKNLHSVKIITNNLERIHVDANGSIGIGTATPWSGGGAKIVQLSDPSFPQYLLQATKATANNKVWRMIARNSNVFQVQTLSDAFGTEQTALQVIRNGNSISNVTFPNGSIGIGTTTPWSGGGSRIVQVNDPNFPQYLLQATNATVDNKTWRMIARNSNVFQIQTLSDAFGTEQTALQVTRVANSISTVSFPNGNVGIGTSDPGSYQLRVTNPNNGLDIQNFPGGPDWELLTTGQASGGNLFLFSFGEFKGSFSSVDGVYSSISDERLKTNIKPMTAVLEKINQLKPSTYQFKNAKDKQEYNGFIAQEVMKIFPSLVSHNVEPKRNLDVYTLDYSGFGVIAIKAIQELSSQNDSLKESNQALNDKLNALSDKINQIENAMSQCCNSFSSNMQSMNQSVSKISDARLDQNIPNPFNNSSSISYYIPSGSQNAQLMITDASGKTLKTYSITQTGSGKQIISGSELTSGMYQYSLLIDGKLIDSKKMVLSK